MRFFALRHAYFRVASQILIERRGARFWRSYDEEVGSVYGVRPPSLEQVEFTPVYVHPKTLEGTSPNTDWAGWSAANNTQVTRRPAFEAKAADCEINLIGELTVDQHC